MSNEINRGFFTMRDGFILSLSAANASRMYQLLPSEHPFEELLSHKLDEDKNPVVYIGHHKQNLACFANAYGTLKFFNLQQMNGIDPQTKWITFEETGGVEAMACIAEDIFAVVLKGGFFYVIRLED